MQAILLHPGLKPTGGSRFVAEKPVDAPRVSGYNCMLVESGPLFVEARVRYDFDNGGFYQLTAQCWTATPSSNSTSSTT